MNSSHVKNTVAFWNHPATIQPNNFVHKSLSNWALNYAVGCGHGCRFCFVPSVSTNKMAPALQDYGVKNPDAEWGSYVLLRPWDERKFLASLRRAEETPAHLLKPDGNRAIFLCSTTDPYQVFRHPDPAKRKELSAASAFMVRRSLELIRDHSTLRVRVLTRSPLAKRDFDLFASFGNRLLFGMSIPTLNNGLAKIYEPKAPSPTSRLETLKAAKSSGLHVYAAMAPTFPECGEEDLYTTLAALAELDPVTIFHEPINIRAENVKRIADHAHSVGISLKAEVFETRLTWAHYALDALQAVERHARQLNISDRLHLWPDAELETKKVLGLVPDSAAHLLWLYSAWNRVSAWPR